MADLEAGSANLYKGLPSFLKEVLAGEEIQIMSRGRIVARLVPFEDVSKEAKRKLEALRSRAKVGDVVLPIGEVWEAEGGRP